MPDALSKTVPIWTAVLNRALFPDEKTFHDVQFPPGFLGASEESQIEKRIDGFVISLNVKFISTFLLVLMKEVKNIDIFLYIATNTNRSPSNSTCKDYNHASASP